MLSSRGVVDFIDVGIAGGWRWPTFNVADIAVSCGAVALALSLWREDARRRSDAHANTAGHTDPDPNTSGAHSDADTDSDTNATGAYSNPDEDAYSNTHAGADTDVDTHADTDTGDACPNAESDGNAPAYGV